MNDWGTVSAVVGVLLTLAQIAIVVIALLVLPGGRRPQTAMAWLLLVLALPFLGFALFLLLGRNTVGRKRRAQQAEVNELAVLPGLLGTKILDPLNVVVALTIYTAWPTSTAPSAYCPSRRATASS